MNLNLSIDNKKIELNEFVENIFENIIEGVLNSLHGIEKDWKELEIKINKNL